MWVLMKDGSAVDNNTGEEIYINLGSDGLVRVYRDNKAINTFHSVSAAADYIEKLVEKLNGGEED